MKAGRAYDFIPSPLQKTSQIYSLLSPWIAESAHHCSGCGLEYLRANKNSNNNMAKRERRVFAEEFESTRSSHSTSQLQQYLRSAELNDSMVETMHEAGNENIDQTAVDEYDNITAEESKGVHLLKMALYLTLLFSAIGVAVAAFLFITHEQEVTLETELEAISDQAAVELENFIEGISRHLSELSTALSAQYQSSDVGESWPNMTLPFFERRAQNNVNADAVFYAPILPKDAAIQAEWEAYAISKQDWVNEDSGISIPDEIHSFQGANATLSSSIVAPIWQYSPVTRDRSMVNLDIATHPILSTMLHPGDNLNGETVILMSQIFDASFLLNSTDVQRNVFVPRSALLTPVFESFQEGAKPFGFVFALLSWEKAFSQAFDQSNLEMIAELQQSCGGSNAYFIAKNGKSNYVAGNVDATSDPEYSLEYDLFDNCETQVTIKPSQATLDDDATSVPVLAFVLTAILFFFLVGLFNQYNRLVRARQIKLLTAAKRTNAVVSSLFPEGFQDRLLAEVDEKDNKGPSKRGRIPRMNSANFDKMKQFLDEEKGKSALLQTKPIADFFPEATIMFADLVGFTAWSSMREPTQVFTLLESIYHAFDEIARRRRVFKVETIGDCYVAVVGLPEPCEEHATVMARFASDCRERMNEVVKDLEVTLGPDTADLAMRIGLHSGPVTAGVLRGDKARFQLFGDTMNTTSRIETTGKRDMIHVSQETADKLIKVGKAHWLKLREDRVTAKGKGELTTYWLRITRKKANRKANGGLLHSTNSQQSDDEVDLLSPRPSFGEDKLSEKQSRLVDWISSELAVLLRDIGLQRLANSSSQDESDEAIALLERKSLDKTQMPLEEAKEIITLPKLDSATEAFLHSGESDFQLPDAVVAELHDFVASVAVMYRENSFHNFEHASHVTMSVVKLLSRILSPRIDFDGENDASKLHDKTYGIATDALTQFTVVLAALIHDVDHPGVSNAQLVKEQTALAKLYKNKSIAEQNSVDKSWMLLMEGSYPNLRKAIYNTEDEFKRFRQLLVNTVMATDIMDKELGAIRKARWERAFNDSLHEDRETAANRKATIVIEHLIQASDIAHTMQHWHIYRKWNGRLFEEMHKVGQQGGELCVATVRSFSILDPFLVQAFDNGRADANPANTWYKGEIDFFDFYIIPLANKLKDCGVFGVSSHEYLNYAEQNRKEWALNGKTVVGNMAATIQMESTKAANTTPRSFGSRPHQTIGATMKMLKPQLSRNGSCASLQSPGLMSPFAASNRKKKMLKEASKQEASKLPTPALNDEAKSESCLDALESVGLPSVLSLLIVEDERISRKLFSRAIKALAPKWKIHEAESGETALDVVANSDESFDIIFLDQFMGTNPTDLLGSEVAVQMRERGIESVICGMSANDVEALFADAGADAFVFKPLPYRKDALLREMNRIFMHSSTDLSSW
eukprot:scaffold331_cov117-Cylindrotheca_fusiformis.AAC.10